MHRAPARSGHILVVEDSPELARCYETYLTAAAHRVCQVTLGKDALERLSTERFDAVLLDMRLPDFDGLDLLQEAASRPGAPPFIVITGHGSIRTAVQAMRAGAVDYLLKPVSRKQLVEAVASVIGPGPRMGSQPGGAPDAARLGFIGRSPAIRRIVGMLDRIAGSQASVFINGESGTGKELCASAIHRLGPRADKPFVALNCAAIPHELMESEMFGHVRGAFTGAHAERRGAARMADGGTLFLDEIGEMDLGLQSKLLRFVQSGTFRRVGGTQLETVDVRFVCATNRDPERLIEEGRLREDLFYRLHVIPIDVPPLRERGEDVIVLARHFLASYAEEEERPIERFSPAAEAAMLAYPWPGNVRELQNAVRRLVVLQDGPVITRDMLPPQIADSGPGAAGRLPRALADTPRAGEVRPLREVEREAIENALDACGGNVAQAAALLEINPSTIYRKQAAWRREDAGAAEHAAADRIAAG